MIAAALAALSLLAAPTEPCPFAGEARAWTDAALTAWARLEREAMPATGRTTPTMVLFDQACVFTLTPDAAGDLDAGGRRYAATGARHIGEVTLPGGGTAPARKLSFAAPSPDGGMFFVMALPALWRADTAETRDPGRLAMVVFMHEFAHTQQGDGLGRRIDALLASGLPEDADDDSLQRRFADDAAYRAAVEAERDLFYGAATAASDAEARALLGAAAASAASRRAERFTGAEAVWAEADDLFLTLEGSGNWAAWRWLVDPRGGGLSPQDATAFMRGGRRWWSQDAGLGLMLALDRLTPDWPALTFGPDGLTGDALVRRALH